ncbi:MAG: immunoglobulin domain-containing protein [Planctomycetota bacterium]
MIPAQFSNHRALFRLAALVAALSGSLAAADVVNVTTTNNFTFSPSVVSAHPGDTIRFTVTSCCHSVHQTSSAASCTAMPGGFATAGCGTAGLDVVIPANATGSIFFMCQCHCFLGMRGRIDIIASCTGAGVASDPTDASTCPGGSASFSVTASGTGPFTYQWMHGVTPVGTSDPTLNLTNVAQSDEGQYTCTITNGCGNATSQAATLTVCHADFDCDGTLDFFDYDAFVVAFEAGDPSSDFDGDGTTDFFDYDAYVIAFEAGC